MSKKLKSAFKYFIFLKICHNDIKIRVESCAINRVFSNCKSKIILLLAIIIFERSNMVIYIR